jgi:cellulose synthase operon protein C
LRRLGAMDRMTSSGSAQERVKRLRELLAVPPPDGVVEELPAIADVGPDSELEGSRSPYIHPPRGSYVRHPWVDEALDAALRERDFVLLSGELRSGKWRTALEAVRRTLPTARLLVPRLGIPALAELLSLDPSLRAGAGPVVVWLDGLERYLGIGDGMDVQMLNRLRSLAPRVVIVASVHNDVRAHLLGVQGYLSPVARRVLDQAATIVVPAEASGHDRAKTDRPNPGEDDHHGIDARMTDISVLERRYRAGQAERDADARADRIGFSGWAVVQAAADWQRMGMSRPVTEGELRELSAVYLAPEPQGQASGLDDAQWAAALQWAVTEPPDATAALLREVPPPHPPQKPGEAAGRAYQPAGFLVGARDQPDIPAAAWEFALRRCDAFEVVIVAEAADKLADPVVAEAARRQATLSLDPSAASLAGLRLAGKLDERGDRAGAIAAYRQCIADGEREVPPFAAKRRPAGTIQARDTESRRSRAAGLVTAALACVNLGGLLDEEGRIDEAAAVFRKGIALDDPAASPLCAINLGGLLARSGDLAASRSAYEQALAACARHGDPSKLRGMAAVDLARVLIDLGQVGAARPALETALDSGHPVAAPRAALPLGRMLLLDGDLAGAERAFRIAAEADDPEKAAEARFQLARLAEKSAPHKAITAYRDLSACGVPSVADESWLRLGYLLYRNGDLAGAEGAYRQAMTAQDAKMAASATYCLGRLMLDRKDWAGARDAFECAADADDGKVAGLSLVGLGDALAGLRQTGEAKKAYFRATRSADPRARQDAADGLNWLSQRERTTRGGANG